MRNKEKAIIFCEEHGIFPHKITNQRLIFYANYPAYLSEKRRTYKVIVWLKNMKEERRAIKWNRLGNDNLRK